MQFDFLTPDLFTALVWAVILIGLAWAGLRLYRDFSGPPQPDIRDRRSGRSPSGTDGTGYDDEPPDET